MNSTLHTNRALVPTAALVGAVTSGSALVQADERDAWTAFGAALDQYTDDE